MDVDTVKSTLVFATYPLDNFYQAAGLLHSYFPLCTSPQVLQSSTPNHSYTILKWGSDI